MLNELQGMTNFSQDITGKVFPEKFVLKYNIFPKEYKFYTFIIANDYVAIWWLVNYQICKIATFL